MNIIQPELYLSLYQLHKVSSLFYEEGAHESKKVGGVHESPSGVLTPVDGVL